MSIQVYSVPGQTEGRSRPIWGLMWVNVSYYKSVHHHIPIAPVGIGNILAIVKTNQ